MDVVHLAAAILLVTSPGETVLLDFRADWCGPCRQMDPVVRQLEAEGYPVRPVNVDQDRALANRFGVEGIPCFVMVVDGREVDRVVGATDHGRLEVMFKRGNVMPQVNAARGQSPERAKGEQAVEFPASDRSASLAERLGMGRSRGSKTTAVERSPRAAGEPFARGPTGPGASQVSAEEKMIRASVRLKIEDDVGNSCGSGTIIDARQGEALILTCGHVFRDAAKGGRIWVDFFGPGAPKGLQGTLIDFDLKADLGLLSVKTSYPVVVAPVAPPSTELAQGDMVLSVGCDSGADPTVRETHVTSINRYVGPANVQVAFQPVQGRSGGGLFTPEGLVVGVCYAADPEGNEGLFAALPAVCERLDQNNLAFVYREAGGSEKAEGRRQKAEGRGRQIAVAPGAGSPAVLTSGREGGRLSDDEHAVLDMLRNKAQGAEMICIVRPRPGAPGQARSEIIVLDHVSPGFLQRLTGEPPAGEAKRLTSLEEREAVRR